MKNTISPKLPLVLFAILTSCAAYAGTAGDHIYWTRGYDGSIEGTSATTTNAVFDENGNFTDRMIVGMNRILDLDGLNPQRVDPATGFRTADSTTPTVTGNGSLYLHIGYNNSGLTGTGTTVDTVYLNSDLVVGRLGIENASWDDATATKTPNAPIMMTAGEYEHYLTFDYQGSAGNLQFFRSGIQAYATTFQFDCNIEITNFNDTNTTTNDSMFGAANYCTLIFGSEEYKRKVYIRSTTGNNAENFLWGGRDSVVKVYSDIHWEGSSRYLYRGNSDYYIYGNTYINHNLGSVSRFILMSGGVSEDRHAGSLTVKGDIYINGLGTTDKDSFHLVWLNNSRQTATMDGAIHVNAAGYTVAGTSVKTALFYFGDNVSNSHVTVNGDINIANANNNFTLFYQAAKGVSDTSITFKGDITITNNSGSEQILGVVGNNGSFVNFYGKIDTSTRTQQTSFKWVENGTGGVVNFKGKVDNTFYTVGLRAHVYNLMNTGGAAIKVTKGAFNFGGAAHINLFGENQLDVSAASSWYLWGPTNNLSGTVNLNGKVQTTINSFNPGGSNRYMIIDFGMSDSGMTSAQMAQHGITADMINVTGAGVAQTITINALGYHTDARVATCYILFRNYIVGEDSIISKVKLSEKTISGSLCYSIDDITQNVLRIEGYTDASKYGVEYYLQETALIDGSWKYELIVIPEPATVAAILGFVALAFAAYRKRRK